MLWLTRNWINSKNSIATDIKLKTSNYESDGRLKGREGMILIDLMEAELLGQLYVDLQQGKAVDNRSSREGEWDMFE